MFARTFASLAIPNYRRYAIGALASNAGTWMGRVAQDWLVLTQLTDHSATALGVVNALAWLPFLLLAPAMGALADRWPKRSILLVTQSCLGLCLLVSGMLTVTGLVQLWHIVVLVLVQGIATALDTPARQAFASELVGPDRLTNAVGLNSASFNLGRLVGPGAAGLVIAGWGVGPALLLDGVSFFAVVVALLRLEVAALQATPRASGRGKVREGMAYLRRRPDLWAVLILVAVLGTFGMNFQVTNALMATQVFGRGPTEFGLLGSVMAIGSLTAALLTARRREPSMTVFLGAMAAFTLSTVALAFAPSFATFAVLLVPVGMSALTALTTANTMVQLATEPGMRGRVMGLYMWILIGGTPLGALIVGRLADVAGARWAILIGPLTVGPTLAVVALRLRGSDNLRVRMHRTGPWQWRPHRNGHGTHPAEPGATELGPGGLADGDLGPDNLGAGGPEVTR